MRSVKAKTKPVPPPPKPPTQYRSITDEEAIFLRTWLTVKHNQAIAAAEKCSMQAGEHPNDPSNRACEYWLKVASGIKWCIAAAIPGVSNGT